MKLMRTILFAVTALIALPAAAQIASNMQVLGQKIKADKRLVVASNMKLTEAEGKGFWPVYDAYQADFEKIDQRIAALIRNYTNAYKKGTVPDETAKKLLNEMIAIEESEVKLRRSYVPKLEKVVPGMKVARYMQLENKVRAVIKYELASEIPLVQ